MTPSDATPIWSTSTYVPPTPRQHRLEASVALAIVTRRPRSVIREALNRLVDQLQWQGVPPAEAVAHVMDIAARASAEAPASEANALVSDGAYLALMERWATLRCERAD